MKNSKIEALLRLVIGITLIIVGITLIVLHFLKVVPAGWEDYKLLEALTLIWVYSGTIIGTIITVGGLSLIGVIDRLFQNIQD